ncbi:hypothetical protein SAMN05216327_103203 [Dyadobacter sp. SG02]|uniref:hypothetical protein n=1 Tax=Dyadobacter sp. SG02 TaxID=1855291 RepID=UPI0008B2DCE3|nr:hypothetical protein [Dyadobacter sp. SG02]SEI67759.1 hypothetical protein SAMN05216327_103203 [Dyadobacter sp. SG02]
MMNLYIDIPRRYAFRTALAPRVKAKQFFSKFGIFALLLAAFSGTDPEVDSIGYFNHNAPGFCTDQNNTFASEAPSGWNGFTTLADFYDTFEKEGASVGKPASGRDK